MYTILVNINENGEMCTFIIMNVHPKVHPNVHQSVNCTHLLMYTLWVYTTKNVHPLGVYSLFMWKEYLEMYTM